MYKIEKIQRRIPTVGLVETYNLMFKIDGVYTFSGNFEAREQAMVFGKKFASDASYRQKIIADHRWHNKHTTNSAPYNL